VFQLVYRDRYGNSVTSVRYYTPLITNLKINCKCYQLAASVQVRFDSHSHQELTALRILKFTVQTCLLLNMYAGLINDHQRWNFGWLWFSHPSIQHCWPPSLRTPTTLITLRPLSPLTPTPTAGYAEALGQHGKGSLWPPDGTGPDAESAQEPQRLTACGGTQRISCELIGQCQSQDHNLPIWLVVVNFTAYRVVSTFAAVV